MGCTNARTCSFPFLLSEQKENQGHERPSYPLSNCCWPEVKWLHQPAQASKNASTRDTAGPWALGYCRNFPLVFFPDQKLQAIEYSSGHRSSKAVSRLFRNQERHPPAARSAGSVRSKNIFQIWGFWCWPLSQAPTIWL